MLRRLVPVTLLLLLLTATFGAKAMGERVSATDIPGTTAVTASTFPTEVLASDTPVLVFFTADWCPYCRRTAPAVAEIARSFGPALKVVTVDYDESPALVRDYRVRGIPVLLLIRNGHTQARTAGAKTTDQLRRFVLDNLGGSASAPPSHTLAQ